jgi:hypothetical protein
LITVFSEASFCRHKIISAYLYTIIEQLYIYTL